VAGGKRERSTEKRWVTYWLPRGGKEGALIAVYPKTWTSIRTRGKKRGGRGSRSPSFFAGSLLGWGRGGGKEKKGVPRHKKTDNIYRWRVKKKEARTRLRFSSSALATEEERGKKEYTENVFTAYRERMTSRLEKGRGERPATPTALLIEKRGAWIKRELSIGAKRRGRRWIDFASPRWHRMGGEKEKKKIREPLHHLGERPLCARTGRKKRSLAS